MSEEQPLDMNSLLEQAQQMGEQLIAAQAEAEAEAASRIIVGQAGGGAVRIVVSGTLDFQSVEIDPAAVDPDEVEMLEDLVLAALQNAMEQVGAEQPGMDLGGVDLGGLDLGGLGGLLGSGE